MHVEYQRKTKNIDIKYNEWDSQRGSGPVVNSLKQYGTVEGLTVGAFGGGISVHDGPNWQTHRMGGIKEV